MNTGIHTHTITHTPSHHHAHTHHRHTHMCPLIAPLTCVAGMVMLHACPEHLLWLDGPQVCCCRLGPGEAAASGEAATAHPQKAWFRLWGRQRDGIRDRQHHETQWRRIWKAEKTTHTHTHTHTRNLEEKIHSTDVFVGLGWFMVMLMDG